MPDLPFLKPFCSSNNTTLATVLILISGSVATGRASLAGQVEREGSDEKVLQKRTGAQEEKRTARRRGSRNDEYYLEDLGGNPSLHFDLGTKDTGMISPMELGDS